MNIFYTQRNCPHKMVRYILQIKVLNVLIKVLVKYIKLNLHTAKYYVKRVLIQFDFWIFYFMYLVLYPFQFSANSFILFNIIACVFERWSSLSLDVLINILLDVLQGFLVFSLTRNSHIRMKTFIPKVCCISRREVLLRPFKVINQNRNMKFCKRRGLEVDRWWTVL